jgi:tetratricopeptide (TPR) repeat protein
MSKNTAKKPDQLENVEQVLSASEAFIEKYQKQIITGVLSVIVLVLLVLGVRNYYLAPREITAQNEMYKAQEAFEKDSFSIALEGSPSFIGFKEIVSDYGFTSTGNLATAYAGICYYKLGQYDNAIKYLSQFNGEDSYFTASVIGLIGDSYVELGEPKKALSYFKKAIDFDNTVISPIYLKKAGLVHESLGSTKDAETNYQIIKDDYPRSAEASDIDKYLARVQK